MAGSDSNWGRIIMAIGKSGIKINTKYLSIKFGDNYIVKNGEVLKRINFKKINNYLKKNQYRFVHKSGFNEEFQQFGHVILQRNIFLLILTIGANYY